MAFAAQPQPVIEAQREVIWSNVVLVVLVVALIVGVELAIRARRRH